MIEAGLDGHSLHPIVGRELSFHHVSVVVHEPTVTRDYCEALGYDVYTPAFRVNHAMTSLIATHQVLPMIEVLWSMNAVDLVKEIAPSQMLFSNWHICCLTENVERSVERLTNAGFILRCRALDSPSLLYDLARVVLAELSGGGLLQMVEISQHEIEDIFGSKDSVKRRNEDAAMQSIALARSLQQSGNMDSALSAWDYVRVCYPSEVVAFSEGAALLSKTHRVHAAGQVLTEGLRRFPESESILEQQGWLAHRAGNHHEADQVWGAFRAKFPRSFSGYYGGGAILRALGRYDEADEVYRSALELWPNAANLLGDFAAVAQSRNDLVEADRRWADLQRRLPDSSDSYLRQVRSLRDSQMLSRAEEVICEAKVKFPDNIELLVEYAEIASAQGSFKEALMRWDRVIEQSHGCVDGYLGATRALVALDRIADAQSVLLPAVRMFPDQLTVQELYASLAQQLGDYPEADHRWSHVRKRFPGSNSGYVGGVNALLSRARYVEADELASVARSMFPEDWSVGSAWAEISERKGEWSDARERWRHVFDRFTHVQSVNLRYARAISKSGDTSVADELLETVFRRFGENIASLALYAENASQSEDWLKAESRWRVLIRAYPTKPTGWVGLAEMFRVSGRLDESRLILASGLERHPKNREILQLLVRIECLRRDWRAAFRIWSELKQDYPESMSLLTGLPQAVAQAKLDWELMGGSSSLAPDELPANLIEALSSGESEKSKLCELMMRFESLGDTCEFGIVQRRFGAEPISLLRWSTAPLCDLIKLLETEFFGVGEAEFTVIELGQSEYTTRDRRFHLFSHTFTPDTGQGLEKFAAQHMKRMQYLRRRLITDLAAGEKIFVYKSLQVLSDSEATALHKALSGYGSHTALLCVCLAGNGNSPGEVQRIDGGLFMGYVERFSTVDVNVNDWVSVCSKVAAAWDADSP